VEERRIERLVQELSMPIVCIERINQLAPLTHEPRKAGEEEQLCGRIGAQSTTLNWGARSVYLALVRHIPPRGSKCVEMEIRGHCSTGISPSKGDAQHISASRSRGLGW